MSPTPPRSTAKRTQQERKEDNQERMDVKHDNGIQSPKLKKQKTSKTSSRAERPEAAAPAVPTSSPRRGASTLLAPIDHNDNFGLNGIFSLHHNNNVEYSEDEVSPPSYAPHLRHQDPGKPSVFASTCENVGSPSDKSSKNENPTTPFENDNIWHGGDTNTFDSSRNANQTLSGSHLPWGFFVACAVASVFVTLLLAAVLYDVIESTLELHQCRETLIAYQVGSENIPPQIKNSPDGYYMEELERQIRYWKVQAKHNEAYVQGYKREYQRILKEIEGEL